jgi:xanthine dehydrogenase YagS FAD-binding subunit
VAVALNITGGTCRVASVILGAAAPVPLRASEAEKALVDKAVNEETARAAAKAAVRGATPLARNAYKLPIFEALVRRALLAAAGAGGRVRT